jgi:branched-chain amino acid transport system substrate-binding protein
MALATALLLPVAAGCATSADAAGKTPIIIGADLELTGVLANLGVTFQRAIELEADNINAHGGIDGRKVQLDVRDNRSDQTVSASNISGFADDSRVSAVVMGACSECAVAAAKMAADRHLPIISLAPASQVVEPVADRPYTFKLSPNSDDSAASLATELKTDNIHAIGLLTTDDIAGQDAAKSIEAESGKLPKATVKAKATVKNTDTDLSAAVRTVVAGGVDALVISAFPTQAIAAVGAARTAGYTGHIYLDAPAAGDLFLNGAVAQAVEKTVMIAPQTLVITDVVATTPGDSSRKQWFNDYMSRYGGFSQYSTYAADAVSMIAGAYGTVGANERVKIRDAIENSELDGFSGPIRMTSGGHSGLMPQALTVLVAQGGRWRLLG